RSIHDLQARRNTSLVFPVRPNGWPAPGPGPGGLGGGTGAAGSAMAGNPPTVYSMEERWNDTESGPDRSVADPAGRVSPRAPSVGPGPDPEKPEKRRDSPLASIH